MRLSKGLQLTYFSLYGLPFPQIFMRYGRQRWKLKGRIEVNSRQSWDGDEMIFMPLITDLINIKVLKGIQISFFTLQ